jgi:hypothetical protein
MLPNNASGMYNLTNQTGTDLWTETDWKKLLAFQEKLFFAEKIILIIFAIFTILGECFGFGGDLQRKNPSSTKQIFYCFPGCR